MCLSVYAHECTQRANTCIRTETRRGPQMPWSQSYRWLWAAQCRWRKAIRVLMAELSLKPRFTILISWSPLNILPFFFIFSFKSWDPLEMRRFTTVLKLFALKSPFIYTVRFIFWDERLSIATWWSSGPLQEEWALLTPEPPLQPLYSLCFTEDLKELSITDSACVLLPSYSVCFMVVGA